VKTGTALIIGFHLPWKTVAQNQEQQTLNAFNAFLSLVQKEGKVIRNDADALKALSGATNKIEASRTNLLFWPTRLWSQ